jgi:hypothetical protein
MKFFIIALMLFLYSCDHGARTRSGFSMSLKTSSDYPYKTDVRAKQADIVISSVRILVARVKFVGAESDSTSFSEGPKVVELDTNLAFARVATSDIPDGTYEKVSFKMHKPNPNEFTDDSDFNDGDGGRYSMVIRGTYDGQDFTFRVAKTMKQDIVFAEPLVIDADNQYNTTLQMNSSGWFNSGKGGMLDPNNAQDAKAIENNIKASFRAFKDKNRDGQNDDDDDDDDNVEI